MPPFPKQKPKRAQGLNREKTAFAGLKSGFLRGKIKLLHDCEKKLPKGGFLKVLWLDITN